jgi:hypothetical protein
MLATRLISFCSLAFLAQLCVAAGVQAGVIVPFQSTETGTYLLQLTSATTSHAVATGTGVSTLGSFQVAGSQDSDFTDPLHQIVSNGLFTQDYGGGATLVGTFSGTATATSATSAEATLLIPFIGGTGALSGVIGGSGTATVTVEFVSTNPDQSQNFTYALSLVGSLEVVPEPSSLALLVNGLVAAAAFFRRSASVG